MLEHLLALDRDLLLSINSLHTPFLDKIMWLISGNLLWLPLYLFLVFYSIKTYGKKSWIIVLGAFVAAGISDFTSVHLFKLTFERLRPCHNPQLENLLHLVKGHCGGLYGFISSHAANTFSVAMFLGLSFRKQWMWALLLFWASIVSFSRIYLGVHYPTDVLGGVIWGIFIGWLVQKLVVFLTKNSFQIKKITWKK